MNKNKIPTIIAFTSAMIISCTSFVGCAKTTTTTSTTEPSTQTTTNMQNTISINSFSDLNNNLKLGCQIGTTGEKWFLNNTNNSTISKYKTNESLTNDLISGKIDAIIVDEYYAENLVANNSQLKINTLKFPTEEYGLAFTKNNEDIRLAVNETIRMYQNDGTINSLKDAYMPTDGKIELPEKSTNTSNYSNTIKVGTCVDFAPFEYYVNDVLYGFDITLLEMVAEHNEWNIEFIDMNFNELIPALENGEIDIIASGMSITDDRHDVVDFSISYFETEQVIVTRK